MPHQFEHKLSLGLAGKARSAFQLAVSKLDPSQGRPRLLAAMSGGDLTASENSHEDVFDWQRRRVARGCNVPDPRCRRFWTRHHDLRGASGSRRQPGRAQLANSAQSLHGGRMLTADPTSGPGICSSIPSLEDPALVVQEATVALNTKPIPGRPALGADRKGRTGVRQSGRVSLLQSYSLCLTVTSRDPRRSDIGLATKCRRGPSLSRSPIVTVEYSTRAAQIAVYQLAKFDRPIPPSWGMTGRWLYCWGR